MPISGEREGWAVMRGKQKRDGTQSTLGMRHAPQEPRSVTSKRHHTSAPRLAPQDVATALGPAWQHIHSGSFERSTQ